MVGHSSYTLDSLHSDLQLNGCGLEIAPYFDPVLRKSEHQIYYTDYVDNDTLRRKADANPEGKTSEIALVDFVWIPGRPLRDCAPAALTFDYVIASHVMEHVPNPVGWLNELLSVTRVGGKVALFLPDRRTCMDFARQLSTFGQVVEWWATQPAVPTIGQITDFLSNSGPPTADDDGKITVVPSYTDESVVAFAERVTRDPQYLDVHCTVWEPDHFAEVFQRVVKLGMLNVEVSTPLIDSHEFLVTLTKLGEPSRTPPVHGTARPQTMAVSPATSTNPDMGELRDRLFSVDQQLASLNYAITSVMEANRKSESNLASIDHQMVVVRNTMAALVQHTHSAAVNIEKVANGKRSLLRFLSH